MSVALVTVNAFLSDFRKAAARSGLSFWTSKKNDDFRSETGATNADIHDIINSLNHTNYNSGPEPDNRADRPFGQVWKFSVEWCGYDLYMKLKLCLNKEIATAECLSCHEQERDMRTPFQSSRRKLGARS